MRGRYWRVVGDKRCPVSDTYWQTETGGHLLTPLPGVWPQPPGSATLPFFGVQPAVLDDQVLLTAGLPLPSLSPLLPCCCSPSQEFLADSQPAVTCVA